MIHFITLSIFPQIFESPLKYSIIKKAKDKGLIKINHFDIRDFSKNKHKKVDDSIYGGGVGQLIMPQPVFDAIDYIKKEYGNLKVIFFTPKGRTLNMEIVKNFSSQSLNNDKIVRYLLLAGRYEGIDNRIREYLVDEEISVGDYILTGGELPALIFIDAVSRYIDGVLGNSESLSDESFNNGLLEYPQYTRPADFRGMKVPEILLSGNHKKIKNWQHKKQLEITKLIRKDLIENYSDLSE